MNASKKRFIEESPKSDLFHLSCHGFFVESMDTIASSGLLLNNEKNLPYKSDKQHFIEEIDEQAFLSAKEFLDLHLSCHLVTLSACETGQSENKPGDELIGLSRSLLYAGTPSILLTLWPVNVQSKIVLMKHFYEYWKCDMAQGKSKALQLAQKKMIDDEHFSSLYHWGAYLLIGDWL